MKALLSWKSLTMISGAVLGAAVFSSHAIAKDLNISAGNLPPHVNKAGEGREAEIIRSTLEACGHQVKFTVQPFGRHWDTFKTDAKIDGVTTVPAGLPMDGFRSQNYVNYHNGVSVLSASGQSPKALSDLAGKRVTSFVGASSILPGMKEASGQFKAYTEKADQLAQSRELFAKRVDAVVGDGLIFAEYNKQLLETAKTKKLRFDPSQPIKFYAVFDPSPYQMVFKDEAIQKDFDKCFNQLKASGEIEAINKKYVDQHFDVVGSEYKGL